MKLLSGLGHNAPSSRRTRLLTVLDVGSSKVSCVIARLRPLAETQYLPGRTHRMEVLGFGYQRAGGMKAGNVVDLVEAEKSIRLAVDAAERMAGLMVDSLIVNCSSTHMESRIVSGEIKTGGQQVGQRDMRRLMAQLSREVVSDDYHVVHSLPVSYSVDGATGIEDPRGMIGTNLGVDLHVVGLDPMPLRNIEYCINRAHLSVEAAVATPLASALAVLVSDETQLGAVCIDIGGGTTNISVFSEGRFVFADTIAIGGNHITLDIARGFSTRLDEAERLKVKHGTALASSADDKAFITVPSIGEEDLPGQFPRSFLTRIIRARVEEIIELARDRLNRAGFGHIMGKRVVITGGASQLPGLVEVARTIMGRNVRIGRPLGISGLPEIARGAAFSTIAGLLIYPQATGLEEVLLQDMATQNENEAPGHIARVGRWLKESF